MNFTSYYNLYVPVRGEYPGSWDIPINENFNSIDRILRSIETHNKGATAPYGKEAGTTWYDTEANKLKIKKPTGYYELLDTENYVSVIGNFIVKDDTRPAPPTGIVLHAYPDTPVGQNPFYIIEATWDPANDKVAFPAIYHDDFLSYLVTIRREGDSFADQKISFTNSFKFYNIKPGFTYNVSVQVIDKQGNISPSSVVSSIDVFDGTIPVAPTGISATGTFKGIIVSWNKPLTDDVAGYEIHASEISNFTPEAPVDDDSPVSSVTLKYSGLARVVTVTKDIKPNTTYYLKVRTKNRSGHWSPFSVVTQANTKGIGTADFDDLAVVNAVIEDLAADDVRASFLQAAKIEAGEIDGDRIIGGSITGDKMAAKTISAEKIIGGGDLADVAANKNVQITAGNALAGGMCKYTATDSGVWQVYSSQLPASATVDLTGSASYISGIEEISFTAFPSNSINVIPGKFIVEISTDKSIWQTVKSVTDNFKPSAVSTISIFVGYESARYVRLTIPQGACQDGVDFVLISNFKVKANQGGTLITGDTIETGSIRADHINTTDLSSISANLGSITAGTIDMTNSAANWIRSGQTAYNAGKGFWLGIDQGIPKFSLGDAQGSGLHWDGTYLKITGPVLIGVAPDGTGGTPADNIATKDDIQYNLTITSTNGTVLKKTSNPNEVLTTLKAIVHHGPSDVTDELLANRFRWTRTSPPEYADEDAWWNSQHVQGFKQIPVTSADVHMRATFTCEIL